MVRMIRGGARQIGEGHLFLMLALAGLLLDLDHHPVEAGACYRRAHLLQPAKFKWMYYWGALYLNQKTGEEAVSVLSLALRLRPDYLAARLKLGEALV